MSIHSALSLFDYMTDHPNELVKHLGFHEQKKMLYQCLIRDLEGLLNSRKISEFIDGFPKNLDSSLLAYGMCDLNTFNMSDESEKEQLVHAIEETIKKYEKRLHNVRVKILDIENGKDNELHVSIFARIRLDSDKKNFDQMIVNSVIQSNTGHISVREINDEN